MAPIRTTGIRWLLATVTSSVPVVPRPDSGSHPRGVRPGVNSSCRADPRLASARHRQPHGGFHTSLGPRLAAEAASREDPGHDRPPGVQLHAAYLLSGTTGTSSGAPRGRVPAGPRLGRPLRRLVRRLTVDGEVLDGTKTAANELYTNVGLALYAFGHRRPAGRQRVEASLRIRRTRPPIPTRRLLLAAHPRADADGRYAQAEARPLRLRRIADPSLPGRPRPEVLDWWRELMDLTGGG